MWSGKILPVERWTICGRLRGLPSKNFRGRVCAGVGCTDHLFIRLFDTGLFGFVGFLCREHCKFMS